MTPFMTRKWRVLALATLMWATFLAKPITPPSDALVSTIIAPTGTVQRPA